MTAAVAVSIQVVAMARASVGESSPVMEPRAMRTSGRPVFAPATAWMRRAGRPGGGGAALAGGGEQRADDFVACAVAAQAGEQGGVAFGVGRGRHQVAAGREHGTGVEQGSDRAPLDQACGAAVVVEGGADVAGAGRVGHGRGLSFVGRRAAAGVQWSVRAPTAWAQMRGTVPRGASP